MPNLILFNKPFGVLSQFSGDKIEETLSAFIKLPHYYPAGRLDKNSEGLLILTDDGKLQHRLSHPNYNKKKYYWVQVEGMVKDEDLNSLRKGITIQGIDYLPATVKLITEPMLWERNPPVRFRKTVPTSWLEIILREGKNHQVRKMTAAIGYPTLRLVRHRIADWHLDSLQPGQYKLIEI
ncbi:MAG: pseudouridine synthase [Proteobacteria bacterium]|nr:pseudouridine synthase [Pseudomonadota bacterium]